MSKLQCGSAAALLVAAALMVGCEASSRTQREVGRVSSKRPPARTAAPASSGGRPTLTLSRVEGGAGQSVAVDVTLDSGGAAIAGTQNDIEFDPRQVRIAARANGTPDCTANRRIGKEGTAFSFLPQGCQAAAGRCSSVRALVLSLGNVSAIPNGSVLYTCNVQIGSATAAGGYRLNLQRVAFSTPDGKNVNGSGVDGVVTVH